MVESGDVSPQLPQCLHDIAPAKNVPLISHRWLTTQEICSILLASEDRIRAWTTRDIVIRPPSGALYLYDKAFTEGDGYSWKEKKTTGRVQETYYHLKLKGEDCLTVRHTASTIFHSFERRRYHLTGREQPVLFHYLNVKESCSLKDISFPISGRSSQELKEELSPMLNGFSVKLDNIDISQYLNRLLEHCLKPASDQHCQQGIDMSNLLKKIEDIGKLATDFLEKVVIKDYNVELTYQDLFTLTAAEWLNDQVVNFYLPLIAVRSKKVFSACSFTMTSLMANKSVTFAKRKRNQVNIFEWPIVLFPTNQRNQHWFLLAVDFNRKEVRFFDSLGKLDEMYEYIDALQDFVSREYHLIRGTWFSWDEWKVVEEDVPKQSNSFDCGIFMCQFARCVALSRPVDFVQSDMPKIRSKMMLEIISNELFD